MEERYSPLIFFPAAHQHGGGDEEHRGDLQHAAEGSHRSGREQGGLAAEDQRGDVENEHSCRSEIPP